MYVSLDLIYVSMYIHCLLKYFIVKDTYYVTL